jgi:hypothetical protein
MACDLEITYDSTYNTLSILLAMKRLKRLSTPP